MPICCSRYAIQIRFLFAFCLAAFIGTGRCPSQAVRSWDQPAAALASQIADLLGPGPVAFSIRNTSPIPTGDTGYIRKTIEASLKTHGITVGGPDSANSVRVTLSQDVHQFLWIAEIVEGNETKIAMVPAGAIEQEEQKSGGAMALRRQVLLTSQEQILAAAEFDSGLLILEPDRVVFYSKTAGALTRQQPGTFTIAHPIGRDPRGMLLATSDGSSFDAWLPGTHCAGSIVVTDPNPVKINCSESDDPWTLPQAADGTPGSPIRAFYNPARNSFTGVLVQSSGQDLPPFFSLARILRASGSALLADGVDGKVQLAENGSLHAVSGTRDWGSDFDLLHSGCGSGAQIIVSGSGDAVNDSLRAYELPSYEAIPASEPLQIDGTVTALDVAADGKSLFAIVRRSGGRYEVDRVSAFCN